MTKKVSRSSMWTASLDAVQAEARKTVFRTEVVVNTVIVLSSCNGLDDPDDHTNQNPHALPCDLLEIFDCRRPTATRNTSVAARRASPRVCPAALLGICGADAIRGILLALCAHGRLPSASPAGPCQPARKRMRERRVRSGERPAPLADGARARKFGCRFARAGTGWEGSWKLQAGSWRPLARLETGTEELGTCRQGQRANVHCMRARRFPRDA